MKSLVISLAFVFIASSLAASTPPPLPDKLPPLLQLPAPPKIVPPMGTGPSVPMSIQHIREVAISATHANVLLDFLSRHSQSLSTAGELSTEGDDLEENSQGLTSGAHRLILRPDTTVTNRLQRAYGPATDIFGPREQETTLITNTISGTGVHTIAAFMRYDGCTCPVYGGPRIYVKSNTLNGYNLDSFYPLTGDPVMAENPYNVGVAPYRMYIVGTDFTADHRSSRLEMWFSDDGNNLSSRNLIWDDGHVPPPYHSWFPDKPSVAVSWYTSSLGYVYVVATRADIDSNPTANPNQLLVFRSTDGLSFSLTAVLSSNYVSPSANPYLPTNAPSAPQIVADPNTGGVYLIWLDWNTNRIYAATSGPDASYFTLLPSIAAGTFVGPSNQTLPGNNPTIQAFSALNARANSVGRNIGVVWHARESDAQHTDVFFAAIDTNTNTWIGPKTVNDCQSTYRPGDCAQVFANSDQWNGALDHDNSGSWLVTFYDRRLDPASTYRLYAAKLTSSGDRFDSLDTPITYDPANPNAYPASDPWLAVDTGSYHTLGEYQDVWFWSGWKACYVYAPINTTVGVYFSEVLP
jgi:hypothetical protein